MSLPMEIRLHRRAKLIATPHEIFVIALLQAFRPPDFGRLENQQ